MSVRIRMKKFGRKHRPFFRVVAVDARCPRDGRVLEELGTYDPLVPETDARVQLKADRVLYWLSVGAQPSDKVAVMIKKYIEFPADPKPNQQGKKTLTDEQIKDTTKNPYTLHNLIEKYGQTGTALEKQQSALARLAESRKAVRGFSASFIAAAPVAAPVVADAE